MSFPDAASRSAALFQRARRVMPGGNTRTSVYWPPYPVYAVEGRGSRVVDVDGVERVDLHNAFTVLIHGHSHPHVVERVQEQAGRLTCVGLPTETEIELAETLCSRVRSFDRIRFTNSGTEAAMNALKAARGYNGRPKFAKCEGGYHGTYAPMEISIASSPSNWGALDAPEAVPQSRGTPKGVVDDVVVIPFNDVSRTEAILAPRADELAAVFIDLLPVRIGMIPARPEFLSFLRDFTREHGIVLVLDEVVTFRLDRGGGQARFELDPDLTLLGKFIGGGTPMGAVAGREEFMAVFDPTDDGPAVWHGGTFNANPLGMAAGAATMDLLTPDAFASLERLGELARRELADAIQDAGVPWQVTGRGSLFRFLPNQRPLSNYRDYYQSPEDRAKVERLAVHLLNDGFLVPRIGAGALSTVTTEDEVHAFARSVSTALGTMKREGEA